jgi:hypothetical protein
MLTIGILIVFCIALIGLARFLSWWNEPHRAIRREDRAIAREDAVIAQENAQILRGEL